jgi:hypothetical protein
MGNTAPFGLLAVETLRAKRPLVSLMADAIECSSDLGGAIGFCNREPKNRQHFRVAHRLQD